MTMIYWDKTGPLVRYENGVLLISDLTPEIKTKWRIGRLEMMCLAFRAFIAAVR